MTAARPSADASGTAFLVAKKRSRDLARSEALDRAQSAAEAFDAFDALARASTRRDPPQDAATPPLLDAAFLVPIGRTRQFRAAARRVATACRKAGTTLTLTGPWPAYNFVRDPESRA